ncbi:MAG TPA: polyphosphate polymerase domain-containing protein [Bacteroidales bacterium]|nr:polyphosphate polymerase domain-containing protein [Bacteroidales bacterium]HRW20847.1 polyphosphate polymerase domain-containing protein [Bacteroidales bacterium]HXK80711.1 polyphosphate polymerase domain-containing protein [Bacteroidales bacterium]
MIKTKNKEYTKLDTFRYERKFKPESLSIRQIENIVLGSAAFFRLIYHPRYVNNIYIDTPELDCFYDNLMGKSQRKKYRIRWYGDIMGHIEGAIFEIKEKSAYRGTKQSFFLPEFDLNENFTNAECFKILTNAEIPLDVLDEIAGMELKLLNSYKRTYYKDITGNFRLTIDNDIRYFNINDNFNHFTEFVNSKDNIVEIKYDEEHNDYASNVINSLPFRMTRNSKYIEGIINFYEVSL